MQVLNSLRSAKQRHPDCQIVKRKGRLYVICKVILALRPSRGARRDVNGSSPAFVTAGRRR